METLTFQAINDKRRILWTHKLICVLLP